MYELRSKKWPNTICLIALSFLHYISSSKAAEKIIRMFEDCSFEDTGETKSYHTYYGKEPDHEILINTVTIT